MNPLETMEPMIVTTEPEWVRSHTIEGRIVGELTPTDGAAPARRIAVIATLKGPALAPRDTLIPLDTAYLTESITLRFTDLIAAALQVGYPLDVIHAAAAQALARHPNPSPTDAE